MPGITTQIYEIQSPQQAEALLELGVDHIGSVILSEKEWKIPEIKETIRTTRQGRAKSSLITLFNNLETVLRTLEYYQPDILHFCEALTQKDLLPHYIELQQAVKDRNPDIRIMRSIPIARAGVGGSVPTLEYAKLFEPVSDLFLTDTLIVDKDGVQDDRQPVEGFVGITGQTCDWKIASQLVKCSRIPVVLAGGVSAENVSKGILEVRPAGVDSCTLTNAVDANGQSIRFKKDFEKVRRFVAAVREAEKMLYIAKS